MKILWIFVVILLILLPQVLSQGGGGRSRRSSSSSRSKSGSSWGSSGRRRSGRNYESTETRCSRQCQGQQVCVKECIESSEYYGRVIWGVFGSGVAGFILYSLVNFGDLIRKFWSLIKFQTFKTQFNKVSPGNMSQTEFEQKANQILNLIRRSDFTIYQGGIEYAVTKIQVEVQKKEKYLQRIKLKGEDNWGSWNATGYILCINTGDIYLWFSKVYDNRERAGQTGSNLLAYIN